jgi:hypothetical protein
LNGTPPKESGASPRTTLVVILGASKWPKWKELNGLDDGIAFRNSADEIERYFCNSRGFNLPKENLLTLFDVDGDPDSLDSQVSEFLKNRTNALKNEQNPARDLIVYYIGHGGFEGGDSDYYLAIKNSRPDNRAVSSLRMEVLAKTVKDNARHIRCYLILDCCFSGEAIKFMQSTVLDIAEAKTRNAFQHYPNKGTALLSSSAKDKPSQAPPGKPYTMFTGALLRALREGSDNEPEHRSLQQIGDQAWDLIREEYGDEGVKPEVRPGYMPEGDVTRLPLFPNFVAQRTIFAPVRVGELFEFDSDTMQCCVVVSEAERNGEDADVLASAVRNALLKYKVQIEAVTKRRLREELHFFRVPLCVSSAEQYENAVLGMCRAEIVVFDVTNFEPAVMLLMGIRSVVRRGVTISSAGGDYVVGNTLEFPFNIKEVNVISHSTRQIKRSEPIDLIGRRVVEGFKQLATLPNYLDLPAFDAIRNLPPDPKERKLIDYRHQVLVLCPFSEKYESKNWENNLKRFLPVYSRDEENDRDAEIHRTLDMKSPRLVAQSLYEEIRRVEMCVVDWTEWRPNVFFELGVRLAANGLDPVCIVEDSHRVPGEKPPASADKEAAHAVGVGEQRARLLELFDPIPYTCSPGGDMGAYRRMVERHKQIVTAEELPGRAGKLAYGFTYRTIATRIDWRVEAGSKPVYKELATAADMLSSPEVDSVGISMILYPSNRDLVERTERGALERRLAAWYYLDNRYDWKEIISSSERQEYYETLGDQLVSYILGSGLEDYEILGENIDQRMTAFREFKIKKGSSS